MVIISPEFQNYTKCDVTASENHNEKYMASKGIQKFWEKYLSYNLTKNSSKTKDQWKAEPMTLDDDNLYDAELHYKQINIDKSDSDLKLIYTLSAILIFLILVCQALIWAFAAKIYSQMENLYDIAGFQNEEILSLQLSPLASKQVVLRNNPSEVPSSRPSQRLKSVLKCRMHIKSSGNDLEPSTDDSEEIDYDLCAASDSPINIEARQLERENLSSE